LINIRFMVVILGLAARRVPRWRHSGGLPGIAPLQLSGKKNGTVSGVGMIRSAAPAAPMPQWHRTNDGPTVTMKGSRDRPPEGNRGNPRRRYGRALDPIQTSMGRM
jgi:hypothetical protein